MNYSLVVLYKSYNVWHLVYFFSLIRCRAAINGALLDGMEDKVYRTCVLWVYVSAVYHSYTRCTF